MKSPASTNKPSSQPDDIIVRFNHEEVRSAHDLHRLLVGNHIERRDRLSVLRGNELVHL